MDHTPRNHTDLGPAVRAPGVFVMFIIIPSVTFYLVIEAERQEDSQRRGLPIVYCHMRYTTPCNSGHFISRPAAIQSSYLTYEIQLWSRWQFAEKG